MQESASSFAPGKVLLLGEHSVVYGHPAVVIPISLGVSASISDGEPMIEAPALGVSFSPNEECLNARQLDKALRALFTVTGAPRGRLTISGDLPFSRGLGSSAAVATAVAKSIWRSANHDFTQEELERAVMESERVLHKNPSGADAAASIRERCLLFHRGSPPQIKELSFPSPFSLTIVDTGERISTATLVSGIAALREREPSRVEAVMQELGALSLQGAHDLQAGRLLEVGAAMDKAFLLLASLGLSTPMLARAAHEAKDAGAFGAKLTGAGGGGCLVALSSPEKSSFIRQRLRDVGLLVLEADVLPEALFA